MFFTTMNLVQSIHLATLAARAPSSRHAGGVGVLRSLSLSAPTGLRRPTFSNQLLSDQEGPPLCLPTKPTQHQRERDPLAESAPNVISSHPASLARGSVLRDTTVHLHIRLRLEVSQTCLSLAFTAHVQYCCFGILWLCPGGTQLIT